MNLGTLEKKVHPIILKFYLITLNQDYSIVRINTRRGKRIIPENTPKNTDIPLVFFVPAF